MVTENGRQNRLKYKQKCPFMPKSGGLQASEQRAQANTKTDI